MSFWAFVRVARPIRPGRRTDNGAVDSTSLQDISSGTELDKLLAQENPPLQAVLDDENLVQELRFKSGKLVAFLSRPDTLLALMGLLAGKEVAGMDAERLVASAHLASEIVSGLKDTLVLWADGMVADSCRGIGTKEGFRIPN